MLIGRLGTSSRGEGGYTALTQLVQHIGNILPTYGTVAVPVENLEALAERAHLRRL